MPAMVLSYVEDEEKEYLGNKGEYQGQINQNGQKHGIGIWKAETDDQEYI